MRSVVIAVLLIVAPSVNGAQDNPLKPAGRMWQTYGSAGPQSTLIKAAYVQGALEGLRVGAALGYFSDRLQEKTDANSVKQFSAGADKVQAKFTPQHASVLDIVHQMDKFYSDYRNTPVCMIQAVQECIRSLDGTASSEEDLEVIRKQGPCH